MIDAQPPRGAFDYLLDPIRDQLQQPLPPPERGVGGSPPRIHIEIEIVDRRAKCDMSRAGAIIALILLALLAWGLLG